MDKYKGLRNAAFICQKLAFLGGIIWVINSVLFFIQYFSAGMQFPNFRDLVSTYGGALIAAIIPILMLYNVGGVIYLLLDIEQNTRKKE
ncbi:MAG TPA: hypothetical protein VFF29_06965 [Bacteroidota bacterium]|nr:hypothetical protein [Bacteroidota bacterium]